MTTQTQAEEKIAEIAIAASKALTRCHGSLVDVKHGTDGIGNYFMVTVQIRYNEVKT